MISNLAFGGLLILAAATLAFLQHRCRRHAVNDQQDDHTYRRRQHRRRLCAAGLIGLIGGLVMLGAILSGLLQQVILWCVAGLLVCGLFALAIADLLATRVHYAATYRRLLAQRDALRAEVRQIQATRGNGESRQKRRDP